MKTNMSDCHSVRWPAGLSRRAAKRAAGRFAVALLGGALVLALPIVTVADSGPKNVLCSGSYLVGTNLTYLTALGHTFTAVPGPTMLTNSFSGYTAIWLGRGALSAILTNRYADLVAFVNQGGILLVELTAPANIGQYPLGSGLSLGPGNSNTVRIVNSLHPINANLTDAGLSGWTPSCRGVLTAIGDFNGLTDIGMPGYWVTIEKSAGAGRVVYTVQDISYHIQFGAGTTGATSPKGVFLDNVLRQDPPASGEPPTITLQPADTWGVFGQLASFTVTASGSTPLSYQWHKNGIDIAGATISAYSLPAVQTNDAGTYSVTVTNAFGLAISSNALLSLNHAPTTSSLDAATRQNLPLYIPIAKLLALASDPDNDPLSLASFSSSGTNGGKVVLYLNNLLYTPSTNYSGFDCFWFKLTDGKNGTATAWVNVQVRLDSSAAANMLVPVPAGNGALLVRFAGIPGRPYTIERATSASGPWSFLVSLTNTLSGYCTYLDKSPPPGGAFYRTTTPSTGL